MFEISCGTHCSSPKNCSEVTPERSFSRKKVIADFIDRDLRESRVLGRELIFL